MDPRKYSANLNPLFLNNQSKNMKISPSKMASPWITQHEKNLVAEMMDSGWDNYKYVENFEPKFAKWHDRKYALMTPCCTHALHLLLLALDIKDGDEVIAPECTWTGSIAPIIYQRAKPVFCDINPNTWCLDIDSVKERINEKTKAIILVDLYGNMAEMEEFEKLAAQNDLFLIEDAAEALGSIYKDKRAGKFGIGGVHSFHRTKTMTTGEGGALLIDDDEVYERAKFLRDHGRSSENPYYVLEAAPKYMPSNYQASLALGQFERINELVDKKRHILHLYKEYLLKKDGLQLNLENENLYNGVWAPSLVFDNAYNLKNEEIISELSNKGVPSRPFFYPMSSIPAYKNYETGSRDLNPNAYSISERGITLPSAYNLRDSEIKYITESIISLLK